MILVALIAGAFAAGGPPAAHAEAPRAQTSQGGQQVSVPVGAEPSAETVTLDAMIYTPPGQGPFPAVVLAHGFGGTRADLDATARDLAAGGYVVLAYSARGFGSSGGFIHLNAPDYEVADARALIDLLAERDDVLLDGEGDPRIGFAGASYGGALALMVAGADPRVDAVVSSITWNDLRQALFPQNAQQQGGTPTTPAATGPGSGPGVFKKQWAALFFAAGATGGGGEEASLEGAALDGAGGQEIPAISTDGLPPTAFCGRFDAAVCEAYLDATRTGRPGPELLALLERSSPAATNADVGAATLLLQGEQDSLFPLDQADANARQIADAGAPVAVQWLDGGHDAGSVSTEVATATTQWFDLYLAGSGGAPEVPFTYTLTTPVAFSRPQTGVLREGYPGIGQAPAVRWVQVSLSQEAATLVAPPGGLPAALTGLPGQSLALDALGQAGGAGYALAVLPGASAAFDSGALDETLTVLGSPLVDVQVVASGTEATLFASLWVVSPDGTPSLPRRLVSPVQLSGLTPGTPERVTISLPAAAYTVPAGNQLRLVLASTDQAYAVPVEPAGYQVQVVGEGLRLPTIEHQGTSFASTDDVPRTLALAAGGVLLVSVLVALLVGRRRGAEDPDAAGSTETPLVVRDLVKSYRNGTRAVDGVSWCAEKGQVVGLLGPNGAGKTTTMRMLMGLIHPEEGTISVLGQPVTPGAPVLSRVGALIEGPGFLPHLSGAANLRAYWDATGRPVGEAHVEQALEIAGLGTAVNRSVRSYSHGMTQRLGIAQAMLGLPEVLLLDEPTNGLDPPQIKAMRMVLSEYAAGGRTVVVSSHLLAEVEQTCSHVVVMHRGKVVATGAVAELLGGQRHLEEVFMDVIGAGGPA